jgi:hypothetical protein
LVLEISYYALITIFTSLFGTTISFIIVEFSNHFLALSFAINKTSSFELFRGTSISHLFLPFTVTAKTILSFSKTSFLTSKGFLKFSSSKYLFEISQHA